MNNKRFRLIFDDVILFQLKELGRKEKIRIILSKMFDR